MVSAHTWKLLEGARIVLGTSGIFLEKKPRNVPELPEPLWLLFADENHWSKNVSECVQNCFSGYWNYSKTHRNIFRFNGRGKMVSWIVKSLYGCFLESHLFGLCPKISRDDMDGLGAPHGGPTRGVAYQEGAPPWSPTCPLAFPFMPLWRTPFMGIFVFSSATLPLWFSYKRRWRCTLHTHFFSHTSAMHDLAFSLPPREIVS